MNSKYPHYVIINLINDLIDRIAYARELSTAAKVKKEMFELYDRVHEPLVNLKSIIETNKFSIHYGDLLGRSLNDFISGFSSSTNSLNCKPIILQEAEQKTFRYQQERDEPEILSALTQFLIVSDLFIKLDFLNSNLVVVGANGCGKTSLAVDIKNHIRENGILISAQRILQLSPLDGIKNTSVISEQLKDVQISSKFRISDYEKLENEFSTIMLALLANEYDSLTAFKKQAINELDNGFPVQYPSLSKLDILISIWNSLIVRPQISVSDGMNLMAHSDNQYHISEMSDGEKVILFIIAQVMLCPQNGFIIVDEPEMHLHPTILRRLWDRLETERVDCKFIYITHDLDFAASRIGSKKLWLRSYTHPKQFHLEEIPDNDIPQPLLLELLGSRQDVLFCEGQIGSLDERIYSILFPNYTIRPVGGCQAVIDYTKAFNKTPFPQRTIKAIGIVDGDFLSAERRASLIKKSIFVINIPDVESLLMDEEVMTVVYENLHQKKGQVSAIKHLILEKLNEDRESEVSKFVSSKVDSYFKGTNVSSGKSLNILESNYNEFLSKVDIAKWAQERHLQIDKILLEKDYNGALQIFKCKHLDKIANENFEIRDYQRRAIEVLQRNAQLQKSLLRHFPATLS
jgi:ABC-type cobalamin/Fe3+-siderophores transport system ATPase subunit